MNRHTAAPWYQKPGANDAGTIYGGGDGRHRGVASVHYQEDPEEQAFNARLIAAAPELLTAVRDSVVILAQFHIADPERRDRLAKMIAAQTALIDRIEGR